MKITNPPKSESELLERTEMLCGLTLAELANELSVAMPSNFAHHKGWSGQAIETFLGATAGSKPIQDFVELGIELKTIPLSFQQTPLETTYVCYAPLTNITGTTWQNSSVRNKLKRVLWVPLEGERSIPAPERVIGRAFMWQPNESQELRLQQDWEEIMELIVTGHVESLTARVGEVLQLRPKAADGSALTDAIGVNGENIKTRPRGFYLRKSFTQEILDSVR